MNAVPSYILETEQSISKNLAKICFVKTTHLKLTYRSLFPVKKYFLSRFCLLMYLTYTPLIENRLFILTDVPVCLIYY
jgi:hypothetical protein